MLNLRNIQAVTRKEFYHLIRDFRSLYLAFALPLLLILLFGYALSLDVDNVETVVVDYDNTDLSRDFIRRLDGSPYFHIAAHLPDTKAATGYLDEGRAILVIVIPVNWTRDIRSDRVSPLQVLLDGSDPSFANITRGYVNAFIS